MEANMLQPTDASIIRADANKQNSTPKEEWNPEQTINSINF